MKNTTLLIGFGLLAALAAGTAEEKKHEKHDASEPAAPPLVTPSPEGASAYIINLKDGDKVKAGEVTVQFGLKGMGVCPAGIYKENTGHHHLLVNMDVSELPKGIPIPTIEGKCLHYGGGQTETVLELEPGEHTLQMVLGNYSHMLHDPPVVSEKITITVE